MARQLNESITLDFTTTNPATGQVQDADVLPTCIVFIDTSNTPLISPIVIKVAGQTGVYRVNFITDPDLGFLEGSSYNVIATATVNAVTGKARIGLFEIEPVPVHFRI